jgi:thiol-disulfide isomerase/thioredoxin
MRFRTLVALLLSWTATAHLSAADLNVGDPAPALQLSKFVKGDEVKAFEKGKIYVVEFWATWCGPCKATIPHLTRLQKAHKDVVVIGVSVLEENQDKVEPFVKAMGDKMNYRVAMDSVPAGKDGDEGKMAETWLDAAELDGIPTAFIVNGEGKIAWIGHPAKMAIPLQKVVAGKWDIAAFAETKKLEEELLDKLGEIENELTPEEAAKHLEVLDTYFKKSEELESEFGELKFTMLMKIKDGEAKAAEYAARLIEKFAADDSETLNSIAWTIVGPETELVNKVDKKLKEVALKAAKRADELTEGADFAISDTLARAYFFAGDKKKAVEYQEKSLKLLKTAEMDLPEEEIEEMRQRLEEYKKSLKGD